MQPKVVFFAWSFLVALIEIIITTYLNFADNGSCQMPLNTWLITHAFIICLFLMYFDMKRGIVRCNESWIILIVSIHLVVLACCIMFGCVLIWFPSDCLDCDYIRYILIQCIIFEYCFRIVLGILIVLDKEVKRRKQYIPIKTIDDTDDEKIKEEENKKAFSV
jgi:hypothetical protein